MKKTSLKTISLDEITDKHIGKRGTAEREIIKVFKALNAKINFNVEMLNKKTIKLA